ncbi:MAG: hypothetical protein ABW277_05575 [Longimicrobiaceae bacterium]
MQLKIEGVSESCADVVRDRNAVRRTPGCLPQEIGVHPRLSAREAAA